MIYLRPPQPLNDACRRKLEDWLSWRGASHAAQRHSEYLHRSDVDGDGGPKILVSAVIQRPASIETYLGGLDSERRRQVRAAKPLKLGYAACPIRPREHSRAIWQIIHSSETRQGRPIAPIFLQRPPDYDFPAYREYGDPQFEDICCGVFAPPNQQLVAYLLGKRVGDHVQYDEIMGHADHIGADVMYLLHLSFLELCAKQPPPHRPLWLNYGGWYSGADAFSAQGGLNRWKRRVNFKPAYLILASS